MSLLTSLLGVYLPHNILILLSAAALFSVIFFTRQIITFARKPKYPVINTTQKDYRDTIEEAVAKYPETPFYISTQDPILVLPRSAVDDIKKLPDSICSFKKIITKEFHNKILGIREINDNIISVVKSDLTRSIPYAIDQVQDELKFGFDKEFGPCEDWKSFQIYQNIARIVSIISGRVFVGRPLSRDDEWVDLNVRYTAQLATVRDALKKWPSWARKIVATHLKEVKDLKNIRNRTRKFITPLINAHLAKDGNEKLYSDFGDEEGNTISWILSRKRPDEIFTPEQISDDVLMLSFASIHTTSNTVLQAIFDLASYREYIPILIEELQEVIKDDGCPITGEGRLHLAKSSLARLSKLDSFLKESQRMNNLSLLSHAREAVVDFKLSDGSLIPKNTRIAIPSWAIHNDSASLFSPGRTKPLSDFDGLRFHNLRDLPGNENRHFFVTTSPESLSFGHGNHACPGRFFASSEIKVLLLEFLRNWDFRFPGDEKLQGGAWRRPENRYKEVECLPDVFAHIELRRKRV